MPPTPWGAPCEGLEVVRETLGNEVALLGAARLVFEHAEDGQA